MLEVGVKCVLRVYWPKIWDRFGPKGDKCAMESTVKKYQQRFKKIKDEMGRWEELQSRLISQFSNASAIIERLKAIQDSRNYGVLKIVEGIADVVTTKKMDSLQSIFHSMNKIMDEFHGIVLFLEKMARDSRRLASGVSAQPTAKQLNQRIGLKPTLAYCIGGLGLLE